MELDYICFTIGGGNMNIVSRRGNEIDPGCEYSIIHALEDYILNGWPPREATEENKCELIVAFKDDRYPVGRIDICHMDGWAYIYKVETRHFDDEAFYAETKKIMTSIMDVIKEIPGLYGIRYRESDHTHFDTCKEMDAFLKSILMDEFGFKEVLDNTLELKVKK